MGSNPTGVASCGTAHSPSSAWVRGFAEAGERAKATSRARSPEIFWRARNSHGPLMFSHVFAVAVGKLQDMLHGQAAHSQSETPSDQIWESSVKIWHDWHILARAWSSTDLSFPTAVGRDPRQGIRQQRNLYGFAWPEEFGDGAPRSVRSWNLWLLLLTTRAHCCVIYFAMQCGQRDLPAASSRGNVLARATRLTRKSAGATA